jgi:hypothetical protein
MIPKEKAIELYSEMLNWQPDADKYIERNIISTIAKQCALIALDEKLEVLNKISCVIVCHDLIDYYLEVKHEIEKL